MKLYRIRFNRFAIADLNHSYEWGIESWGFELAQAWLDRFELHIEKRLSQMPTAFPVAPENAEFEYEIRQLIFGRYRVLFTIRSGEVVVLRIRGPFNVADLPIDEEN